MKIRSLILVLTMLILLISSVEARPYGAPARWCGFQMRLWFGGGPYLNLARNWAYVGYRARGPRIGVIVVWRHHVGFITGHNGRSWIVKSGNDGGRVRERPRSLRGVIAFRWPHSRMAMR